MRRKFHGYIIMNDNAPTEGKLKEVNKEFYEKLKHVYDPYSK